MFIKYKDLILSFAFFILGLNFIDALFQQLQLLIPSPIFIGGNSIFKILLLLTLFYFGLVNGRLKVNWLTLVTAFYVIYIIFDLVYMIINGKIDINNASLSFASYYFFILIVFVAETFIWNEGIKLKIGAFISLYIALLSLGISQGILNDPIISIGSADKSFEINSWGFYHNVRSFSLFSSPANYGHYITLSTSLLLSILFEKRYRFLALCVLVFSTLAVYMTLTRATYIEYVLTLVTVVAASSFVKRSNNLVFRSFIYILPVFYAAIVYFSVNYGLDLVKKGFGYNLLSADTIYLRYLSWSEYWQQYVSSSMSSFFLGSGYVQNDKASGMTGTPIDNLFLAIIINTGLVGLIGFVGVYIYIWVKIVKEYLRGNREYLPLMAYWSSFVSTSIFGVNSSSYMIAFAFFIILARNKILVIRDDHEPYHI